MTTATATRTRITPDTVHRQVVESAYRRVDANVTAPNRPGVIVTLADTYRRTARAAFRECTVGLSEVGGWTNDEWADLYDRVADTLAAPRFQYPVGAVVAVVTRGPSTVSYPEGRVVASTIDSLTIEHRGITGPRQVTVTRDSWEDGRGHPLGEIDPATGLLHTAD